MATKDLGNKLICQDCGAKYYDLKKKQPVCPKCGAEHPVSKPKTRRAPPPEEAKAKPAEEEKPEVEDDIKLEPDVDDALIEDDSDDDGEAVTAVIENVDEKQDSQ